ncbi:uncharacterized protein BO80DRAFT_444926 [Aspergillus ibericus CBS 121593]|uniref:Uncharacterized protein n=1 Tax=Aspergillus ibericus CBS 121593 TaxID=1448316 RepID=A0A395H2H8_9EURO|nr:hypothetical protein BO80DRAFT_444926 [Aspergillus ibericus CBS 121593]RAL01058.1 hypothetical protein BO80DRAFT_444926 [Aspergillus ibericus CBS 121593]
MFTFKNIFMLFALFGLFIQAGLATPLDAPTAVANVDNTVPDNVATAPVDASNEAFDETVDDGVDDLDDNDVSSPITDSLEEALKPVSIAPPSSFIKLFQKSC